MLCKREWSWELRTWSDGMYLLHISSTSPHYLCSKWIGETNENSYFDLMVYRVNWAISLIIPQLFFFFFFQFQISDQPYRQTCRLDHQTSPWYQTPDQTTTSEYHNGPSSDLTTKSDHQNKPPPSNQTNRSDHPTRPRTTILDSSASKQHSIPNIPKWYRSGAFIMGWVKEGI